MTTEDVKQSLRNTPMGKLLVKYGFEPYDTESSARSVAERAAEEIAAERQRAEKAERALGIMCEALEEIADSHDSPHNDEIARSALSACAAENVSVYARKDSERLRALRELCGYVEDGSAAVVKLYQDDATGSWFCEVGKKAYFSDSFAGAIDAAKGQP